jgi:hypothetical protein
MYVSEEENRRADWKCIEEIQLFKEGVIKCIYLLSPLFEV